MSHRKFLGGPRAIRCRRTTVFGATGETLGEKLINVDAAIGREDGEIKTLLLICERTKKIVGT
jgi:hypothetical protein